MDNVERKLKVAWSVAAASSIPCPGDALCLDSREFRRTVLELGRRLGVKPPGRAQQPTASPKALEEEFTKIICFIDFLECPLVTFTQYSLCLWHWGRDWHYHLKYNIPLDSYLKRG